MLLLLRGVRYFIKRNIESALGFRSEDGSGLLLTWLRCLALPSRLFRRVSFGTHRQPDGQLSVNAFRADTEYPHGT